ncbi:hypothetical protein BJ166DRAFT_510969 [Pestalotiopsis sp. NC0098]|nr:hypothetical protein BJ166DRAFT_510969 [Pestalotiopsis sp. NC0098]
MAAWLDKREPATSREPSSYSPLYLVVAVLLSDLVGAVGSRGSGVGVGSVGLAAAGGTLVVASSNASRARGGSRGGGVGSVGVVVGGSVGGVGIALGVGSGGGGGAVGLASAGGALVVTGLDGDGADRGDEEEDGEELHFGGWVLVVQKKLKSCNECI